MNTNMNGLVVADEGQEAHAEEGSLLKSTSFTEGPLTPW
jgi:hypothetical protein